MSNENLSLQFVSSLEERLTEGSDLLGFSNPCGRAPDSRRATMIVQLPRPCDRTVYPPIVPYCGPIRVRPKGYGTEPADPTPT